MKLSEIKIADNRRRVDEGKAIELAESIKEIGLINPITVDTDGNLIAGAHRYRAFQILCIEDIPCHVIEQTGLKARLAEIDENLIRNELQPLERGEQLLERKHIYEELYPESRKGNTTERHKVKRHNVALQSSFTEDTAQKTGRSQRSVQRDIAPIEKITPEVKEIIRDTPALNKVTELQALSKEEPEAQMAIVEKVRSGQAKNVATAQREVKRDAKKAELKEIEGRVVDQIQGIYDVVVIDPPWPMQKIDRDCRPNQSEFDYPTMSIEEIKAFQIPAENDCHLWLWTTQKFLPDAFDILKAWDFKYICSFVWHKNGGIQPYELPQYNCEFALYARKGSPFFVDTKAFNTCFQAKRGKHSEKPEEFYSMVRRVTAGKRIDIFNRRPIEGFDVWGNQA